MSDIQNSVEAGAILQSGQDHADEKYVTAVGAGNDNSANDKPEHYHVSSELGATATSPPSFMNTEENSPSFFNTYLLGANEALNSLIEEDKLLNLKFRKINKINQLIHLVEVIDAQKDFCDCLNMHIVDYYGKKNRYLTPILPHPKETRGELYLRYSQAMTFLDQMYQRNSDVEYIVDSCIYMTLCKCDEICKAAEHLDGYEMLLAMHSLGEDNVEFERILEHEFDPLWELREMLDDIRSEFENEFNRILFDIEFVERSGEIFMLLEKLAPIQINLGYLPIGLESKIYLLEKFHECKTDLEEDMYALIREMYTSLYSNNVFTIEMPVEFSLYDNFF